ncbi:fructosamine kinase family protein [Roseivivax isoporae]|uniref:Aminoglycoside phosphotransferase n=1 Tax=Roseivivax isoporae LMG 25204 TaxID=1449351 RepID=X7F9N2_9RHOB|nr:fructosamine kinase family protein [Roseivivax isoporae]ETX28799.1 aminoglycoside phosphotransferase [Roseivivax isoporae LMG 25204]
MTDGDALPRPLLDTFGSEIAETRALSGGDLSEVRFVRLEDGREMVVKTGPLVHVEARMLSAMALLHAPVPQVVHVEHRLLCLEHLPEVAPTSGTWRDFGTALAQMHGWDGGTYGWNEDYAFGSVPIPNAATDDWPSFWAERRLLSDPAALPADLRPRVERLAARAADLLPGAPKASLLHGDLWGGNIHFTDGRAVMIDPASYYGHSEVDLAMLTLFGNPDTAFWRGYGKPEPGWEERRPVYQLWPAMVHLRLFGGGYHAMIAGLLDEIGI